MSGNGSVLVLGGLIRDIFYCVDRYPQRGMDSIISSQKEVPGGCALNVAVSLKNMGLDPYLVAAIGDTPADRKLADYLREWKLQEDCVAVEASGETGFCVNVVESDGERTFLTYKGIESIFRPSMVPAAVADSAKLIYLTGYYLQEKEFHGAILDFLADAKARGAGILFDPGSLVGEIGAETLSRILALSFCVTPNEQEWEMIKRSLGAERDLAGKLFEGGLRYLLLKNGNRGVRVLTPGAESRMYPYQVETVDTTGAGDCFAAGFLYGLAVGERPERALSCACACGSLATTFPGPHGEFSMGDIDRILEEGRELRF